MADPKSVKNFVVTNTTAHLIIIAGQHILPGATSKPIDAEYIEGVKNSPPFKAGHLKEGVHAMPEAKIIPLEKMSVDQAKKLISTETDPRVLAAWSEVETRPDILAHIAARVKGL